MPSVCWLGWLVVLAGEGVLEVPLGQGGEFGAVLIQDAEPEGGGGEEGRNDTRERARVLGLGEGLTAVVEGRDVYRLEVPANSELSLRVSCDSGEVRAVRVSRADGGAVGPVVEYWDGRRLECWLRESETLWVEVEGEGEYRLSSSRREWVAADAYEYNDQWRLAARIEPGAIPGLVVSGRDFYRFEVGPYQRFRVIARTVEGEERLLVWLSELYFDEVLSQAVGSAAEVEGRTVRPMEVLVGVEGEEGTAYSLEFVCEAEGPGGDAFEPNDGRESAAELGEGSYPELVRAYDDWYRLEVPARQVVRVTASFSHGEGDVDLELTSAGRRSLGGSYGEGDREEVVYGVGVAETVYLRVFGGEGAKYGLDVSYEEWEPGDPFEPNEDLGSAAAIEPGRYQGLVCGTSDYYAVEVAAGQRLRVGLEFACDQGDFDLWVLGPGGERLCGSATYGDDESVELVVEEGGVYFVRVYARDSTENTYSLTILRE